MTETTMSDAKAGRIAVIIGGGPAGLTAAHEFLERTDITPVVYEMSPDLGGLARTVNHHGNRMDIGGHRFFSKSERVLAWWQQILPLHRAASGESSTVEIGYQNRRHTMRVDADGPDAEHDDKVMLIRDRISRIYFLRKFFSYPLKLDWTTLRNLGVARVARIAVSYARATLFPIRPELSLEDFFINRFGRELYRTFFKDYTEKVWGVSCQQISAEWGAQRVKGLSVTRALWHAAQSVFRGRRKLSDRNVETSLIEQFMYPKLGPGQMWEEVARRVRARGGEVVTNQRVVGLELDGRHVRGVKVQDATTGHVRTQRADFVLSSMPVRELVAALGDGVPEKVRATADGLVYRDFITAGVLVKKLAINGAGGHTPDNWIYIQEPDVKLGRLQIFNNWSPYMVADPETVWLGLEYFCNEGDALWTMPDADFMTFAVRELETLGIIAHQDVLDGVMIRVPKAYPAYYGTYDDFHIIRSYVDEFENLFLIGRNGMHRYNNQDHSMLTAMAAVENIAAGVAGKDNIWAVNAEQDYHEAK